MELTPRDSPATDPDRCPEGATYTQIMCEMKLPEGNHYRIGLARREHLPSHHKCPNVGGHTANDNRP